MSQKSTSTFAKVLYGVGAAGIAAVVGKLAYDKYNEYLNKAYTTGKITDVSGNTASYTYEVDGIKYRGSVSFTTELNPQNGESYMVEYSSEDPNTSKMLLV